MKINLAGSFAVVHSTLHLMSQNGIPFTHYTHYHDGLIISMGSRKVVSHWGSYDGFVARKYSYSVLVRKRDLDLIILLSTAEVTS